MKSLYPIPLLLGGWLHYSLEQGRMKTAREKSASILQFVKEKHGIPGLVLGVSVNGKNEMLHSVGFSDIETLTEMRVDMSFRMASISKTFASVCTMLLYQQQKVDLDKPIQEYVPTFPVKVQDGIEAPITLRKLLNHTSGIRHYFKKQEKKGSEEKKGEERKESERRKQQDSEYENKEFHSNVHYSSTLDALNHFKDDDLYFKQGEFGYTTHGYTLIQAAIEKAASNSFKVQIEQLCAIIGLKHTEMDSNNLLIKNRCRHYYRKKDRIFNCPEVDLSNKFAGGGLITTAEDLLRFGNFLLYCYQNQDGPIKQDVLQLFLKDGLATNKSDQEKKYSLGFSTRELSTPSWIVPRIHSLTFGHSGGAVGCTSNLIIIPSQKEEGQQMGPQGIVVIIAGNLTHASGIKDASQEIADLFWEATH